MAKPIVLFDFDGVFNILDSFAVARNRWDDVEHVVIPYDGHPYETEFTVIVAKPITDFLGRLVRSDVVDVRWLSTWVHNTEKFSDLLDYPDMPWMERPDVDSEWIWWKLEAVKSLVEEVGPETPILWVDDDHGFDPPAIAWLKTQKQILALAPDSTAALSSVDIKIIRYFVEKHTGMDIPFDAKEGPLWT
jgi:hypothetical protein